MKLKYLRCVSTDLLNEMEIFLKRPIDVWGI